MIDGIGAKAFVKRADELAAKYGPRFQPSEGLRAMAAKGESFYGKYAPKTQAAA
jgi:3-hydroxyacyl-CoA dehydrogenase/enoyl-CoA hydratase/3-hydroxybutyryl-CoA epimerase